MEREELRISMYNLCDNEIVRKLYVQVLQSRRRVWQKLT